MGVIELLQGIRTGWVTRLSHHLAKGIGVRESIVGQLQQFFDALQQAVITGDPAWLEPVLLSWLMARPEFDLDIQEASLAPFVSQVVLVTQEYVTETLVAEDAVKVTNALLPLFTYAYERLTSEEMISRVKSFSQELERARGALESLDKSKSDFISVAAHELKTPLTLIEGYAMMLREQYPSEDEASYPVLLLKGIDNGTRRLHEIVNDMIDVSLIDNKMLILNFQPMWVGRLLAGLKDELNDFVKMRKQTILLNDFVGAKEMTYGDPERLYQAFRNLLTNSVKYTPDGGTITVDGRMLPGFIEITFKDTGIGIDPEDHTRIFEKFGQLGNVSLHSSGKTKFKGGGPGLGLPITKGIIEAHGGTIWVESDGHDEDLCPGAIFHVMLPLRKASPDEKMNHIFSGLEG